MLFPFNTNQSFNSLGFQYSPYVFSDVTCMVTDGTLPMGAQIIANEPQPNPPILVRITKNNKSETITPDRVSRQSSRSNSISKRRTKTGKITSEFSILPRILFEYKKILKTVTVFSFFYFK